MVEIEMHLKWRARCEGGELFCSISEPCPKCIKAFARARMKLFRESGALPCIHVDPVTITCKLPI